ncbi:hypothetical protein C0585_02655 [Candidatus Woesearchaeota archaeon]|nr:MAG: hypothetical protein C0585_02655 [Candidatus Woesearchaeota archaeon]
MELDILDKKILYELGINSRITYDELSKKIKSKKPVVAYRINQLIKNGVIWKFAPLISLKSLGYFGFKIYIRLKGLDNLKEEEMIRKMVADSRIVWVAKGVGSWDLLLGFFEKSMQEVAVLRNEIFQKYGRFIQDYSITFLEDGFLCNRDYLTNNSTDYRNEYSLTAISKEVEIEEIQKKILTLIKNDARYKVVDLANELKLDSRTIISKIKDLEKKKILQINTVFLNLNKIGRKLFKICIYFQEYEAESEAKVINYLKTIPELIHLIKSIGDWEMEAEIEYEDINDAYQLIKSLRNKFPDIIKKTDIVTITEELKLEFIPKII